MVTELRSGDNAVNGAACGRVSMFLPLFADGDKDKKPWWLLSASPYWG